MITVLSSGLGCLLEQLEATDVGVFSALVTVFERGAVFYKNVFRAWQLGQNDLGKFPQDLADEPVRKFCLDYRETLTVNVNGFRGPLGKEQIGLVNFRGQTRTGG